MTERKYEGRPLGASVTMYDAFDYTNVKTKMGPYLADELERLMRRYEGDCGSLCSMKDSLEAGTYRAARGDVAARMLCDLVERLLQGHGGALRELTIAPTYRGSTGGVSISLDVILDDDSVAVDDRRPE